MKTSLFVVIIALTAAALSGCSIRFAYPPTPAYGMAEMALYPGAVTTVHNPSPYDQFIRIEHAVYKYVVDPGFFLPSGAECDLMLDQGKYVFWVDAQDVGKKTKIVKIIPATGYVRVETAM